MSDLWAHVSQRWRMMERGRICALLQDEVVNHGRMRISIGAGLWHTSKMSMEGWWMVQTTVRPVLTVFRTVRITMAAALASRPDVGSSCAPTCATRTSRMMQVASNSEGAELRRCWVISGFGVLLRQSSSFARHKSQLEFFACDESKRASGAAGWSGWRGEPCLSRTGFSFQHGVHFSIFSVSLLRGAEGSSKGSGMPCREVLTT